LYDNTIATVGELVAALDHYDPTTPIQLATQPGYPLESPPCAGRMHPGRPPPALRAAARLVLPG
jgi:hypothetical protein